MQGPRGLESNWAGWSRGKGWRCGRLQGWVGTRTLERSKPREGADFIRSDWGIVSWGGDTSSGLQGPAWGQVLRDILEARALEEAGVQSRQEVKEEKKGGGWEKWADVCFLGEEWLQAGGGERRAGRRMAVSTQGAMVPRGGVWGTQQWLYGDVCGQHGGIPHSRVP